MTVYSAKDLKRLVDLPAALIRTLAEQGHIHPVKAGGMVSYSFKDLLVLRTASALRAAKIPSAKITDALGKIRESLPAGASLSLLALAPNGRGVAVREGQAVWESSSGQYALPLAIEPPPPSVATLKRRADGDSRRETAELHFAAAYALEESDLDAARAGYLAALEAHADHLEARINLGRLLHLGGEFRKAERIYRDATQASALLSFNLAILLEDLEREEEALTVYREALALDPNLHDAHFNLSRLYERAQQPADALRHLIAYRRLAARRGEET
jgi:tetratricopeptide (TPR) repeat protein